MRASYASVLLLVACAAETPDETRAWKSLSPAGHAPASAAPRKVSLRPEQSHFLTVQRSTDGTLRTRCVQGEIAAQQSLSVSAPPAVSSPGPPRSAP